MTVAILSERPVGVRRSWIKRTISDLAEFGEYLRQSSWLIDTDWGDPIEAQTFRERKGTLRRIEAAFANGRTLSITFNRNHQRIERVKRWRGGA